MGNRKLILSIFLFFLMVTLYFKLMKYLELKNRTIEKVKVFHGEVNSENIEYLKFLKEFMMSDGAISSEVYLKEKSVEQNKIIFSESQGLVMEIATYLGDEKLFKDAYSFLNKKMKIKNSLYSWKLNEESERKSLATSTIDDLRIYRAFINAHSLWGGYEKEIYNIEEKLKESILNDCFVDFIESGRKGKEFSIFYIDGEALNYLEKIDLKFKSVKENMKKLVQKSQKDLNKPFYKEVYLISKKKFKSQESYNMLHSFLIIYNKKLLEIDIRSEYEYVKKIFSRDGAIYSEYDFNGNPLSKIESSSIYSYLYLIAFLEKDEEFLKKINMRLESILGKNKNFNNLRIPISNDEKVYSFDLLTLILASMRRKNEKENL